MSKPHAGGYYFSFLMIFILLGGESFSQQRFSGIVKSKADNTPLSYTSIMLKHTSRFGWLTDTGGRFSIWYPRQIRKVDSLLISAIGYEPEVIALSDLSYRSEILLTPRNNLMEQVVVVSTLTGHHSIFNYYRAWSEKATGGEIGQIMELPSSRVQVGPIQVKVNMNFDTCYLRLHLRAVGPGGEPEEDILKNEIIVPVITRDGLVEFDLNLNEYRFPNNQVFVGFEIRRCSDKTSGIPSFFFTGSRQGKTIFRRYNNTLWESSHDYTIYMRMMVK